MFLALQLALKVLSVIEEHNGTSNKVRFPVEGVTGSSKGDAKKAVADLQKMGLLDPETFDVSARQYDGDLWCMRISWENAAQGNPLGLKPEVLLHLRKQVEGMMAP